ncbi:hypothetical protein P4V47_03040 [Brevibacillus laterosporus]|uniref:hypothetical protein n=1 Tax=Brevibacillus laterosporus TaxID=1465 RepID=UPI002E21D10A|nr:hypothetical protein [Brevibacillus laterosporus]
MKKYPVTKEFLERFHDYKHYREGDIYSSNKDERAIYLQELGFIGEEIVADEEDNELLDRLKKLDSGYYELPNGKKVRGKKKALEELQTIDAGEINEKQ